MNENHEASILEVGDGHVPTSSVAQGRRILSILKNRELGIRRPSLMVEVSLTLRNFFCASK